MLYYYAEPPSIIRSNFVLINYSYFCSLSSYDNAAPGWLKWWKTIETATEKVNKRLVELAQIKQVSKVLDIATGLGEPSLTAAKQVGKTGNALAIDISSQMLSFAKQRAIISGLHDIVEFKEGDA